MKSVLRFLRQIVAPDGRHRLPKPRPLPPAETVPVLAPPVHRLVLRDDELPRVPNRDLGKFSNHTTNPKEKQ